MIPTLFSNRDLHILQGLKVKGLLSWLSQDTHPAWLLPELRVRTSALSLFIKISLGLFHGLHKIMVNHSLKSATA
jgi:hypothetical protein